MGWTARIILAVIVLAVFGTAALGLYESSRPAPLRTYQQVIPNDRFTG
jgi:hypothetical protein